MRFRAPQPPAATPVVFATCLVFFSATTMFIAFQAARTAPMLGFAVFGASVFLAVRAAVLVARFQRSRRDFDRAIQEYQTGLRSARL